jgi:hypothetical protein
VAASSATNAWVFAQATKDNGSTPLYPTAQRWNGHQWVDQTVFTFEGILLNAITSGPSDAWAFGYDWSAKDPGYIAHYNGHQWKQASLSIVPSAVGALSGSDIWVAGTRTPATNTTAADFTAEHYVKGAWHKLPPASFSIPKGDGFVTDGINPQSDTSVWAGLSIWNERGEEVPGIILLHYNGKAWQRVGVSTLGAWVTVRGTDEAGGIWLQGTDDLYHYSDGKWAAPVAIPQSKNAPVELNALTSIPGTKSLWAVGEALPVDIGNTAAVILKDGL